MTETLKAAATNATSEHKILLEYRVNTPLTPRRMILGVQPDGHFFEQDPDAEDSIWRKPRTISDWHAWEVVQEHSPERFVEIFGHAPGEVSPHWKIIDGVRYDTQKAKLICTSWPSKQGGWFLFKTPKGRWFEVVYEHVIKAQVKTVPEAKAKERLERHAQHLYEEHFQAEEA